MAGNDPVPNSEATFQIRLTAVWRSLNFLTGTAPGRLFQISTRRAAGQSVASLFSPAALRKRSAFATASASIGKEALSPKQAANLDLIRRSTGDNPMIDMIRCFPQGPVSALEQAANQQK
jgi:hypothetical protein